MPDQTIKPLDSVAKLDAISEKEEKDTHRESLSKPDPIAPKPQASDQADLPSNTPKEHSTIGSISIPADISQQSLKPERKKHSFQAAKSNLRDQLK